jgi:outer membrane autotransporter protein
VKRPDHTSQNFRKSSSRNILTLFFFGIMAACLAGAIPVCAENLLPGYSDSVQLAIVHANDPTGWQPASLYVIPDGGGGQGLVYDSGKLVTRTAVKSGNYTNVWVGKDYTIWGNPAKEAAWVTVGKDATRFLTANGVTGDNATKLIERGLGMNDVGNHDAIIEYTVDTGYLMRPTKNPDITQYLPAQYGQNLPFVKPGYMSDVDFEKFKTYYNYWVSSVYNSPGFPFSQLGYTFFWGNGYELPNITGMSEFIILGGTPVGIYGIYGTRSYIYTRNDGANFSSAPNAEFGNGFASFKIDGTCDTVWAGHRFQKNVRADTSNPNQVIIENSGSILGGQGLLIWSLNYDVINNGIISGPTSNKFNIQGTSDIAVLFRGDTSNSFGNPVITPGAVNRLINAGTISSPGTAIKAQAGDTHITNNAGGMIFGGSYAIETGAGNDSVTVNGGQITGRIDLGPGIDTINVTGVSPARFNFTLDRTTASSAKITNAETVSIANGTNLAVTLPGTQNIRDNERFLIVDAIALTTDPANLVVTTDTPLPMVGFLALKESGKLYVVSSRDNTYYAQKGGNPSLGYVLDNLANSATGDLANVLGDLDKSGSPGNALVLQPSADMGTLQTGLETLSRFTQNVTSRIDQLRKNNVMIASTANVPIPDTTVKWNAWTQGFGMHLKQDAVGSSMGYTANIWGGSLGMDRYFSDHSLLGASGGYAKSYIRTSDTNTWTDIDSYSGSIYASFFTGSWYLDGVLSYAHNKYDASRHIFFGTTDRIARSDYTGNQCSGYLEGGYTLKRGGWHITPLLSLQYARLHLGGYTETGADSVDLSVNSQEYDLLQSGIGGKFVYPVSWEGRKVIPEVHVKWLYDFIGDRQQVTSTFTGGGASFSTDGFTPPQSSYSAGARITLITKNAVTASLNYDFGIKENFYSHAGYVNINIAF